LFDDEPPQEVASSASAAMAEPAAMLNNTFLIFIKVLFLIKQ
jgi:hypothetical protein